MDPDYFPFALDRSFFYSLICKRSTLNSKIDEAVTNLTATFYTASKQSIPFRAKNFISIKIAPSVRPLNQERSRIGKL